MNEVVVMIGLNVTVKCYKVSLFQDLSLIESFKKKKKSPQSLLYHFSFCHFMQII